MLKKARRNSQIFLFMRVEDNSNNNKNVHRFFINKRDAHKKTFISLNQKSMDFYAL